MNFNKLYKLDKGKNLKDLKIGELEGKENELVRGIILKNFWRLFNFLELFNEGKPFPLPHGPKKRIPDSLAFSEKLGKRLYIFEYKSRIDRGIIDQTIKYRNALQENNDNLNHLRDYWTKTGWTTIDFKHKARIICIAPSFDDDTKERESKQEEIYLVEMSMYNLKNEQLVLLKGKHEEIINLEAAEQAIDKIINDTPALTKEQGVSLLFSTEYNPKLTEEVKKWVLLIEKRLQNEFNLVLSITAKARYFTFYTKNNDYVLRIPLNRQKLIRTFFDFSPTQLEEKKIINDWSLIPNWWWRKNDHEFVIKDEKSFCRFFDLLNASLKNLQHNFDKEKRKNRTDYL